MAGFEIRDEMNGIAEAPGKVWFWELEEAVIDAGRCIQCGACVAACPSDSIGVGSDDLPELVKMCTGCSLCWDFCPRGGLRYEATWDGQADTAKRAESDETAEPDEPDEPDELAEPAAPNEPTEPAEPAASNEPTEPAEPAEPWKITGDPPATDLGRVLEAYSARAVRPPRGVQDGGVVTALLIALLEARAIDGAVLARESASESWKAEPFIATTADEVVACAGSYYNQTLALGHLSLAGYDLPPDPRLVLVGTPCEIQGLRAMQARPWRHWGSSHVDAVVLTVALLCTKSFNYHGLMLQQLRDQRGVDLDEVGRVDVIRGKLIVDDSDGNTLVEEPVRAFHGAALKGCDECADFLGYGADISVGSVGSADGYTSVLVRTMAGRDAFAHIREGLELRPLEAPDRLRKLQGTDRRIALDALQRRLDPDAPLFIDFADHVADYAGTDRAPVRQDR